MNVLVSRIRSFFIKLKLEGLNFLIKTYFTEFNGKHVNSEQ